ncbi:uncharacterized protein AB675_2131 [Cyphellophora attinorum]|uniref:Uncharacterized protein n=1 Tax=Cyphellophora attinorum TaxID=1664694 RepID=A0A0N1HDP8_9EURO|nr:uncharacterized protein AB675_2131 [Phialophora attinorum]KPI42837.1 hypothetical protein AB675_2131 [Phialophora attinorum]
MGPRKGMSPNGTGSREELWEKYFGPVQKLSESAQIEGTSEVPATKRKRADTVGDTAEPLEEQVTRLKKQLDEAYRFIAKSGDGLRAPESIRVHLDTFLGATAVASMIRNRTDRICGAMESKIFNAKKSGVTSDDLSKKLEEVLPDIARLSRMPEAESMKLAWDLVVDASERSWIDATGASTGYGDRGFDIPADLLLEHIAIVWKDTRPGWNYKQDREELARHRRQVGECLDEEENHFYTRTLALMKSW